MSCSDTRTGAPSDNAPQAGRQFFPPLLSPLRHAAGMKTLLLGLMLASLGAAAAEMSPQTYAAQGRLLQARFATAPFPHASRALGYRYQDQFFPAAEHYTDNTVALFIPKNFQATNQVDFVVHFHGWRNSVTGALQQFQLIEQLVASERNAILIVPQGPLNAPDSSGGKLEDVNGFNRFMAEAMSVLQTNGVIGAKTPLGNIVLSGHSGGYQVMSAIVAHGGLIEPIKEVWLFDGLYAQAPRFLRWAEKNRGRLLNIYTENGGTKARTEEMMNTLKQQKFPLLASSDEAVSVPQLRTNQFIFLATDLGHNDVLAKRKTFQTFLEASCLSARPQPEPAH